MRGRCHHLSLSVGASVGGSGLECIHCGVLNV